MKFKFNSLFIIFVLILSNASSTQAATEPEMGEAVVAPPSSYEKPDYLQSVPEGMPSPYEKPMGPYEPTDYTQQMSGMPEQGALQPPSPEEFAQWYQEVNKEVDQFKSTLSDDDRKQFDTEVENLTKVMTDILETEGPEGLDKFIDSLFQGEGPMPEAPAVEEEVKTPTVEVETKQPEKTKEPEVAGKSIEAAAKMIEDLIFHTERFLRKSEIMSELPGKIERWVEHSKVKEWKANVSWETLKSRIELLTKEFENLREIDPKTKQYRYLSHLVQDESLYNNMSHLLATLTKYEPIAEAPPFGMGKVSGKPKEAIKEVLSGFMEAIYKLEMIQNIEKVTQKYEPRAKELREEEETSRKKALEESKKPRVEAPKKETPYAQPYGAGGTPSYGAGAEYGYPMEGGYAPGGYYEPSYPYSPSSYDYGTGGGTPSAGGGRGGKPGEEAKGKGGKDEGKAGAKGKEGKEKGKAAEGKVKADPTIKRLIDKVDSSLDEMMTKISESKLGTIETHMTDGSPVDVDLASITLPTVIRKFKTIIDNVKTVKNKASRISKAQSEQALQELRAIATGHKATISSLYNQIMTVKSKLSSIPADKQYAYFGGKQREKAHKDTVSKIPQPVSVEDLSDLITQFNTEVGPYGAEIETGKSKPSKRVAPAAAPAHFGAAPATEEEEEVAEEEEMPAAPVVRESRSINRQIDKFDTDLETAVRKIEENPKLRGIQKHINDAGQPVDAALITSIKNTTADFNALGKLFQELNKKITALPAAQQKTYLEQIGLAFTNERADLIENMVKQLTALTKPDAVMSDEKRYAYLGGKIETGARVDAAALAKKFPETASLADLLKAIHTVYPSEADIKRMTAPE